MPSQLQSIVILPAYNGSTTVVLDWGEYVAEGLCQHSGISADKTVPHDPIPSIQAELQKILTTLGPSQGLTSGFIELLSPSESRTLTLYLLPNINTDNHPGCPLYQTSKAQQNVSQLW